MNITHDEKYKRFTDTLSSLIQINSPSGYEEKLFEYFIKVSQSNGLVAWSDGRNAYASNGKIDKKKPTILISAHGDEVGMVVSGINENGFVKLNSFSGFWRVLPGLEVEINGREKVKGIIGCKPPHLLKPGEMDKIINPSDLFIDTCKTKSELNELISIGDRITYKKRFYKLHNNRIAGSAIDNKISVAILLELTSRLSQVKINANVVLMCSSAEEIGSQGASHAIRSINPDIAISVDTCSTKLFHKGSIKEYNIDDGFQISDGALINKTVSNALFTASDNIGVKSNHMVYDGDGGESGQFIHTDLGVPTGAIFIPIRYLHQPVEVFDLSTTNDSVLVLSEFIRGLPHNIMGVLA